MYHTRRVAGYQGLEDTVTAADLLGEGGGRPPSPADQRWMCWAWRHTIVTILQAGDNSTAASSAVVSQLSRQQRLSKQKEDWIIATVGKQKVSTNSIHSEAQINLKFPFKGNINNLRDIIIEHFATLHVLI